MQKQGTDHTDIGIGINKLINVSGYTDFKITQYLLPLLSHGRYDNQTAFECYRDESLQLQKFQSGIISFEIKENA